MTKKKKAKKVSKKKPLLLSTSQQPLQSSPLPVEATETEETPTSESPENPSGSGLIEPSEKSAATDPFEAAVNEVGNELGGEFAEEANPLAVDAVDDGAAGSAEDDDDTAWIREIVTPENVTLYLELPFDGVAMITQKPHLSLKKHEKVLIAPLVRKWCRTLLESSDSPESAAFMLFLVVYGTRVGMIEGMGALEEWMPKIRRSLGLAAQTAD